MTFQGEVTWTVTANVKIRADSKSDAIKKLKKNIAGYIEISAEEQPTQILQDSVKYKLHQVK